MADDPKTGTPGLLPVRMVRSKDFRVSFSNTFRFRVGAADIGIAFGYQTEIPGSLPDGPSQHLIIDEVEVVITPTMLKLLSLAIADNIEAHETATGKTIELPQQLLDAMAEQKAKRRADLTEELKAALKPKPASS
jgi:hypothetical protein